MKWLYANCPECENQFHLTLKPGQDTCDCPHCSKQWDLKSLEGYESCPFCQCTAFYKQKSLNPKIGLSLLVVAVILVPWTYGLSLPALWFFDLLLHKIVPTMVVCYRCLSGSRGFEIPARLNLYKHHIGEKYEKEREQR